MLVVTLASATLLAGNKQPVAPLEPAKAPIPPATDEYIHKEFGDDCSLLAGPSQFEADLDGDGVEDLIVAAHCRNPLADQAEYGFRVIDPYDTYLGYGNVKITSGFNSEDPDRKGVVLLIVHGVGPQAWRANVQKAKFVMINLPFKTLAVKRLAMKKRTVLGIYMEEAGEGESMSSVIFWDGKKYRYNLLGATME
jgi:hypothetical protein